MQTLSAQDTQSVAGGFFFGAFLSGWGHTASVTVNEPMPAVDDALNSAFGGFMKNVVAPAVNDVVNDVVSLVNSWFPNSNFSAGVGITL